MAETHHKVRILHSGQVLPFPSSEFAQFALSWHRGVISFGLPLLQGAACCVSSSCAQDKVRLQEMLSTCRSSIAGDTAWPLFSTELLGQQSSGTKSKQGATG